MMSEKLIMQIIKVIFLDSGYKWKAFFSRILMIDWIVGSLTFHKNIKLAVVFSNTGPIYDAFDHTIIKNRSFPSSVPYWIQSSIILQYENIIGPATRIPALFTLFFFLWLICLVLAHHTAVLLWVGQLHLSTKKAFFFMIAVTNIASKKLIVI